MRRGNITNKISHSGRRAQDPGELLVAADGEGVRGHDHHRARRLHHQPGRHHAGRDRSGEPTKNLGLKYWKKKKEGNLVIQHNVQVYFPTSKYI